MAEIRIVSLIASATEMVCALGCESQLVGRSHECDFPASITRLPVCTEPKFPVNGTSVAIDQRVRAIIQEGLSVYRVDVDLLNRLRPTHLITQVHCEVCAVSLRDVEQAVCQMVTSRPAIVSLEPNTLADVWHGMQMVADALGVSSRGQTVRAALENRMEAISALVEGRPRPRVASIEWLDPLMVAGNWMPELVVRAGGEDVLGVSGTHSPILPWETFVASDPEIIVIHPCGWNVATTLHDLPALTGRPGWNDLRAVRTSRVYVCDGNQFFNRPGPRLMETLEILAELFHPDVCRGRFSHEGSGWVRLVSDVRETHRLTEAV